MATGFFQPPSIAVDSQGNVHLAILARISGSAGLWYATNASSVWSINRVPAVFGGGDPSIAVDGDGSVSIVFTTSSCGDIVPCGNDGAFLVTNKGGSWSSPQQMAGQLAVDPSLLTRGGVSYLTYADGGMPGPGPWPVWYGNDAGGAWAVRHVVEDGNSPSLFVGSDGLARVLLFSDGLQAALERPDGGFELENLPGTERADAPTLAGSDSGALSAAWSEYDSIGEPTSALVATRGSGGWSNPVEAVADASLAGFAVGPDGTAHVLASSAGGPLYAPNSGGTFTASIVLGPNYGAQALALDPSGRPILILSGSKSAGESALMGSGLWYTTLAP